MNDLVIVPQGALALYEKIEAALTTAADPDSVADIERTLDRIEGVMRAAGLFPIEQIQRVNETRWWAAAKLGRMLSELAPGSGGAPARAKSAGRTLLDRLNLPKQRASELSRIAAMPDEARTKALKAIYRESRLAYTKELVEIARPYWSREQREARHCAIKRKAEAQRMSDQLGPFPLLYCDPPWTFETWHPSGQENARMPNQHYPVLTDAQLCSLHVNGTPIQDIAAKDACLFLWCTSSNIERALGVMRAWGFTFKTNAVWDKALNGTGYIFLNQHEHVLYGTRGSMPAPLPPLPSSVIRSPRGRHSEKPREVRSMIEQMFPQFDSKSRIELFARGQIPGWTTWGFEA